MTRPTDPLPFIETCLSLSATEPTEFSTEPIYFPAGWADRSKVKGKVRPNWLKLPDIWVPS